MTVNNNIIYNDTTIPIILLYHKARRDHPTPTNPTSLLPQYATSLTLYYEIINFFIL